VLVEKTVEILENEPIDIYVNPTFPPEVIADVYDRLWTEKGSFRTAPPGTEQVTRQRRDSLPMSSRSGGRARQGSPPSRADGR